MKKTTLISGYVTAFILLTGILFKSQHYAYANMLIVIGCVLFSLVYGIMLFIEKNKIADTSYQKAINILVLIMMLIIPTSFMFKLMHWPGSMILFCASHTLMIIAIPLLIVHAVKAKDTIKNLNFHNEAIIFIAVASFSMYIAMMRPGKEILKSFIPINTTLVKEMKFQEAKSNELFAILENTVNVNSTGQVYLTKAKEIKNASDSLNAFIFGMEKLILVTTKQWGGNPDSFESIKTKSINKPGDSVCLIEQTMGKQLKQNLIIYKELVGQNTNNRGKEIISTFFNTDDPKPIDKEVKTWEDSKFEELPLISVLTILNQMRSDIRLLEAETMSYLQAMAAISKPASKENEPVK